MKFLNKIILFFLLSIVVSCNRCNKYEPPEPEICEINGEVFDINKGKQQMIDYMYFKVGTYWIYEEETSGALDTITVYYNNDGLDTSDFDDYHWFVWDSFSSYTEYNFKYEFHESFTGGCAINSACRCHKVQRAKTQPGDFVGANRDFFFPIQVNDYQYIAASDFNNYLSQITSISEDFILNNLEFNNVAQYNIGWCESENSQSANFWLAENVGIIKKELIDDNEIWNLIEYQIEQ